MSDPRCRVGDRVRVTTEGTVTHAGHDVIKVAPDGGDGYRVAMFTADPSYGWQVTVLDPAAIPQPPKGSIVVHQGRPAWRTRGDLGGYQWQSMATGYDHDWADLADCDLVYVPPPHSLDQWRATIRGTTA